MSLITSLRNLGATAEVLKETENIFKPKINLWLCLGLIKKDNFELVVEKATELGVSHIIPVLCDRSEKKNLNIKRLQKIAIEASEQSGRASLPSLEGIKTLTELFGSGILPEQKIFLDRDGWKLKIESYKDEKNLAVFVGPEGGWSPAEVEAFA